MQKNIKTIIILLTVLFSSCIATRNKIVVSPLKEEVIINSDTILQTGWYYILDENNGFKRQLDKDTAYYFIDPKPIVTAKNIEILNIYLSISGVTGLSMKLDEKGTEFWSIATKYSIGNQLAFILDNRLLQVSMVNSQITGGMAALNRGIYTREQLEDIKKIIEDEKE